MNRLPTRLAAIVAKATGDDVVATHYCGAGNQPTMRLNREKSSERQRVFDFVKVAGVKAHDEHISDGRIVFKSDDKIEAEWNGIGESEERFFMTRIK